MRQYATFQNTIETVRLSLLLELFCFLQIESQALTGAGFGLFSLSLTASPLSQSQQGGIHGTLASNPEPTFYPVGFET